MSNSDPSIERYWRAELRRGLHQTPRVPPMFVAEQGLALQVADIRSPEEAAGVAGYIPGSVFPSLERLRRLDGAAALVPLVLVCADGEASAELARELEASGVRRVAAMEGGIAGWRRTGFTTSRDRAGISESLPDRSIVAVASGPWTVDRVIEHIGDRRSVRWVKLSSMMAQSRLSCIDGRDARAVIGCPGGDSGMFLLTLAAIEQVTGSRADERAVERGLLERLDRFGRFYLHSDSQAFAALIAAMRQDPRLRDDVSGLEGTEAWLEFLRRPPSNTRPVLLEHLMEPEHVGCGHIGLMMRRSEEYGIRREAVAYFLRAFYRLWWEGAPEIVFTVLPGDHRESALVNVCLASGIWGLSNIPLISPSSAGRQIFVHHPGISSYLRRRSVLVLARERGVSRMGDVVEQRLQEAIEELGERQLCATVGYLAKGLPVFEVTFADDGSYVVRAGQA